MSEQILAVYEEILTKRNDSQHSFHELPLLKEIKFELLNQIQIV